MIKQRPLIALGLSLCATCLPVQALQPTSSDAIDLSGFSDVIKHWDDRTGETDQSLHAPDDIRAIADNLLLYQRNNGGWPTNKHPLRRLTDHEKQQFLENKQAQDTSFDNRNIYPQIEYLAAAYQRTGDERYLLASQRGLEFVLQHQLDNGGFTHSPPRTDAHYGHITFADEVMPGVLGLLRKVAYAQPPLNVFDEDFRTRAATALAKGDELLLRLQVSQAGTPTVWAGQYDRKTLEPVAGRAYELPALQSWESVSVVKYLMSIEQPSDAVKHAIMNAVRWFDAVKIGGIKLEKKAIDQQRFNYHTATYDLEVVADPQADPLWARFYEIETNQPFLANRDGSKVYRLADVKRERRSGYSWYGDWPQALLDEHYPRWRQLNAAGEPVRPRPE